MYFPEGRIRQFGRAFNSFDFVFVFWTVRIPIITIIWKFRLSFSGHFDCHKLPRLVTPRIMLFSTHYDGPIIIALTL
jgi:hypothetical protein